jgi:hypothetical protein
MAAPHMRKKKLKVRIGLHPEVELTPTPLGSFYPTLQAPTITAVPKAPEPAAAPAAPAISNYTFEDYKAANLNINQQQDLIGRVRDAMPLIDRDEIDSLMLEDMAKQLQLCVFPMCKMMHIDPLAVKRMLDDQFRKAYGMDVKEAAVEEQEMTMQLNKTGMQQNELMLVEMESASGGFTRENTAMTEEKVAAGALNELSGDMALGEPAKKKFKREPIGAVEKELRAYKAKKKRAKKRCRIVTFGSRTALQKWAELTGVT